MNICLRLTWGKNHVYSHKQMIFQLQLLEETVNTHKVLNISWVPNFSLNLLSTIFLSKKKIKIFLKKTG